MNRLLLAAITGAVLLLTPVVSGVVQSQQPTPIVKGTPNKKDTIEVRPGGDLRGTLGKTEPRQKLIKEVNYLVIQQNVKDQALKKLREGYDGTPGMALKIHLVNIEVTADLAPILAKLTSTIYDLEVDVKVERHQKIALVKQREQQVRESQKTIDELGHQLIEGKDRNGKLVSEEQLDYLRALLHQRILQRNERQADARRYAEDVTACEQEIQDLTKLSRRLDGMALVQEAYLERLIDAVDNTHRGLVKEEVVEGRKQLQEVVAALKARADGDHGPILGPNDNRVQRQGVAVGDLSKHLKTELRPDERKLVEEELQKLKKRMEKSK